MLDGDNWLTDVTEAAQEELRSKVRINCTKHVFRAEWINNSASKLHLTIPKVSHQMDIMRKASFDLC